MLVVTSSWYEFGLPEGLFGRMETMHGIHGGGVETSMMLHLHPQLVHERERRNFDSLGIEMAGEFSHLSPTRRPAFAWQAQDLNLFGACGDALDADEGRGRTLLEHAAASLLDLLSEVDRFPLDLLRGRV
jgi:creatinine amidohydrolase